MSNSIEDPRIHLADDVIAAFAARLRDVEIRVKKLEELMGVEEPDEEVTKEFVKSQIIARSLDEDRRQARQSRVVDRILKLEEIAPNSPRIEVVPIEERDRETVALLESVVSLSLIHEPSSLARIRDVAKILLKKWKES